MSGADELLLVTLTSDQPELIGWLSCCGATAGHGHCCRGQFHHEERPAPKSAVLLPSELAAVAMPPPATRVSRDVDRSARRRRVARSDLRVLNGYSHDDDFQKNKETAMDCDVV